MRYPAQDHSKRLSKSSVSLAKDCISGVLAHALDEELIPLNPTIGLTKHLQIQRNKTEHLDPLNQDEGNLFISTCLAIYPEHYAIANNILRLPPYLLTFLHPRPTLQE